MSRKFASKTIQDPRYASLMDGDAAGRQEEDPQASGLLDTAMRGRPFNGSAQPIAMSSASSAQELGSHIQSASQVPLITCHTLQAHVPLDHHRALMFIILLSGNLSVQPPSPAWDRRGREDSFMTAALL